MKASGSLWPILIGSAQRSRRRISTSHRFYSLSFLRCPCFRFLPRSHIQNVTFSSMALYYVLCSGEKLLWEKNRNLENEIKVLSQQLRSQSSSPFGILSSPSPVSHTHLETSIAKTTQQVSTPTEMSHGVPGRTTCFQCGLVAENNLCCGRCFNAIHCSRKCQEKHWKAGHKNTCDMKLASFKDSFEGHALQDELSQRTKVK